MKPSILFRRALVVWLVTALSISFLSYLMDSFNVGNFKSALVMAAVFGLINSLIWPLIIRIALPLAVLTLGFGVLLLNGLVIVVASSIGSQSVYVESILSAIFVSFGITLVNAIILSALAVDDDDFYYLSVVKRSLKKAEKTDKSQSKKGVFFLEIDGLSHEVLVRALRDGNASTMARWIREGSHKLISWETDWSSQTGAMQAGILHGNNSDMPAFRWWEKKQNRSIVSNRPKDAMEIERRHSNGKGLLANGGASRANLLSGDAPYSLLTMSTVLKKDRGGRIGQDYYTFFANPYNLLRTVMLTVQDIVLELWQAGQQKRLDVVPRVHRGFVYALLRAWTTVIQRDLQVQAVIGDMLAGRSVAYTTFLGYDEVAHHSGIERIDALAVLRKIDKQFRRIEKVKDLAPIDYELVVLSDHGQTQGATFLQRYGLSLEQLVTDLTNTMVEAGGYGDESATSLKTSITEVSGGKGLVARSARLIKKNNDQESGDDKAGSNIVVMASGCLGLVYFKDIKGRASLEQINQAYPDLVESLTHHPGIGFIMVKNGSESVVIGKHGKYFLESDRIEGSNPLKDFGKNAREHILRTSGFSNCADIMINSTFWPMTGEVAAFEELVGSHGGLGGTQNHPFVLYPSTWQSPKEDIVGAEALHFKLIEWLKV